MGEFEGKAALITGAGSGLGKASAKVFVRERACVVVGDISGGEHDTAKELAGICRRARKLWADHRARVHSRHRPADPSRDTCGHPGVRRAKLRARSTYSSWIGPTARSRTCPGYRPTPSPGSRSSDRIPPRSGSPHVPFQGRCLPGEARLPLRDLIRAAFENSPGAALDIEVLNADLNSLPIDEGRRGWWPGAVVAGDMVMHRTTWEGLCA